MLNLCRAAQLSLMHTHPVRIKKKTLPSLAGVYQSRRTSMSTLKTRLVLISGRLVSHQNAETRLHTHRTAEVFFVLSGRWRFFWGRWGDAGDVILEPGDIFNIPTGMFRGFENIGSDYGMIMAILGGDDAGGGVVWAPQVIEDAKDHGLILGENAKLYDSKRGRVCRHMWPPCP